MRGFRFLFRLNPPGFFGLPDGDRMVIPAGPEPRTLKSPVLDNRSGKLVSHGTLPLYRQADEAVSANLTTSRFSVSIKDNFLDIGTAGDDPQAVTDGVLAYVDTLIQALSSMYGERFLASLLVAEDETGAPLDVRVVPRKVQLFAATVYNTAELSERFVKAATWAAAADDVARKALFYFEHACLLNEFSQTLPLSGPHAAFSRASAFLQLFKALTSIIGDPSSDRDYQSRCRSLGLPKDFWQTSAKPLYDVRNEDDVAHYTHELPEPGAFMAQYSRAVAVFREAFEAHMNTIMALHAGANG